MRVSFVGVWVYVLVPASRTFLSFFMSWAAVFASGAFLGLRKGGSGKASFASAAVFCFFAPVFLSRLLHSAAFPCLSHAAVVPLLRLPLVILQRFSLLPCFRHRLAADTSFAPSVPLLPDPPPLPFRSFLSVVLGACC